MARPFQSYEQWPRKWSALPPMLNIGVAPETACPSSSWGSESRKWFFTLPVHRLVLGEQWSWKRILPFPHVSSMRVDPGNGYVPSSSFVRCRLPLAHARRAAMLCARRVCATRFLAFEVATSDPMLWFVSGSPAEARVRPQSDPIGTHFAAFLVLCGTNLQKSYFVAFVRGHLFDLSILCIL